MKYNRVLPFLASWCNTSALKQGKRFKTLAKNLRLGSKNLWEGSFDAMKYSRVDISSFLAITLLRRAERFNDVGQNLHFHTSSKDLLIRRRPVSTSTRRWRRWHAAKQQFLPQEAWSSQRRVKRRSPEGFRMRTGGRRGVLQDFDSAELWSHNILLWLDPPRNFLLRLPFFLSLSFSFFSRVEHLFTIHSTSNLPPMTFPSFLPSLLLSFVLYSIRKLRPPTLPPRSCINLPYRGSKR